MGATSILLQAEIVLKEGLQPCYIQLMIETSKGISISSFVAAVWSSENSRQESLR